MFLVRQLQEWFAAQFRAVCDEGVRLGIGAAANHVEYLAEVESIPLCQHALLGAAAELRQLSVDYGKVGEGDGA